MPAGRPVVRRGNNRTKDLSHNLPVREEVIERTRGKGEGGRTRDLPWQDKIPLSCQGPDWKERVGEREKERRRKGGARGFLTIASCRDVGFVRSFVSPESPCRRTKLRAAPSNKAPEQTMRLPPRCFRSLISPDSHPNTCRASSFFSPFSSFFFFFSFCKGGSGSSPLLPHCIQ